MAVTTVSTMSFRRREVHSRRLTGRIGTCRQCKKGYYQMCDNELVNGVNKGGGCM